METLLEDLQSQMMELQKAFDDVNSVVIDQSREIDRLRQEVTRLKSQLETMDTSLIGQVTLGDEKPPHY